MRPGGEVCVPILVNEVRRGVSQLWQCRDDRHELFVITRVDSTPPEWCVCWVCGTGTQIFAPLFIAVARSKGWRLRAHVDNLARARLFRRIANFQIEEYVLRVQ